MAGATGFEIEAGNTWVRPRTLAALRWVAAAAQVATIVIATYAFDIALPLVACGLGHQTSSKLSTERRPWEYKSSSPSGSW